MLKHEPPERAFASIWRPGDPDRRVSGVFSWDGSQGTAVVEGHLQDEFLVAGVRMGGQLPTYEILHAVIDGVRCTLIGCQESTGSIAADEYVETGLIFCAAFITDTHLDSMDHRFESLSFRFDSADDWFGRRSLTRKRIDGPPLKYEISFEAGDPDVVGTWKIVDGYSAPLTQAPLSVSLTRLHTLVHRPAEGLELNTAIEVVKAVQRLAGLCSGWLPAAEHVTLTPYTQPEDEYVRTCALFFDQGATATPKLGDRPLVTLAGIGGAAVLEPWLDRHDIARTVVGLLLAHQSGELLYFEHQLMNLALCAELLDRHDHSHDEGGDVRSDAAEFAAMSEQAIAAVSGSRKKRLKSILKFANQPQLSDRLERLAHVADPDGTTLFAGTDRATWAQVAARCRNTLTHADGLAASDRVKALSAVRDSLRWVVTVALITPLRDDVNVAMLTSRKAQHVASQLPDAVAQLSHHFNIE